MSPTRTAPDLLTSLQTGWNDAMQQWWDQSQTAADPWRQAWEAVLPGPAGEGAGMPLRHHHGHHQQGHHQQGHHPQDTDLHRGHRSCACHSRRCGSCRDELDDCANPCHCCVPDADVLLHARAGERRVIPFVLRNPWHREREVTLAVGPWQGGSDGHLEVQAAFEAGESITLQSCEKRIVRLVVQVRAICDGGKEDPNKPADPKKSSGSAGTTKDSQGAGSRSDCDVDSCASAYADVRFEGCARPQRVGVVVHPVICDAVELPCECGCSGDCGCC